MGDNLIKFGSRLVGKGEFPLVNSVSENTQTYAPTYGYKRKLYAESKEEVTQGRSLKRADKF